MSWKNAFCLCVFQFSNGFLGFLYSDRLCIFKIAAEGTNMNH